MFRRIHENFQIVDRGCCSRGIAAGGVRRRQRQEPGFDGHRASEQFNTLDTNRDGRISRPEAANDTKIVFSSADKNGDGYLDSSEYMSRGVSSESMPTHPATDTESRASKQTVSSKRPRSLRLRGLLIGRHACGNALKLRSRACDYGPMPAMLRKDFDEFLFAPVGNDASGMPVTLLTRARATRRRSLGRGCRPRSSFARAGDAEAGLATRSHAQRAGVRRGYGEHRHPSDRASASSAKAESGFARSVPTPECRKTTKE